MSFLNDCYVYFFVSCWVMSCCTWFVMKWYGSILTIVSVLRPFFMFITMSVVLPSWKYRVRRCLLFSFSRCKLPASISPFSFPFVFFAVFLLVFYALLYFVGCIFWKFLLFSPLTFCGVVWFCLLFVVGCGFPAGLPVYVVLGLAFFCGGGLTPPDC